MAKASGKIARRYAKAIFEAIEPSKLEAQKESLFALATAWREIDELRIALLNPSFPIEQRQALVKDLGKQIHSTDDTLANLLLLLLENKRTDIIPEISEQFSAMVDALKKALSLEIVSATELSDAEKDALKQKITSKYGDLAKVEWKVDSELIGGLVIKSGDKLLDSSVKGALEKARAAIVL